jgi:signal transduction histidine kinase
MFIVNSTTTARAREVQRQKQRYESAYLITDKVASRSLDIALATTMAEVGNFLHELRNASTPTVANLMILKADSNLSDESREAVESLERGNSRCNELIDNLLGVIQGRTSQKDTTFNLRDVLDGDALVGGLAPADRRKLKVVGRVPEFEIDGNPEHLKSAISNLLMNALQAGSEEIRIRASFDGGMKRALVTVEDDGPGIPDDLREGLFLPEAAGRGGEGHGLGLPLAKRLVEVLGGDLRLVETGERGTTFEIVVAGRHIPTSSPPERRATGGR